MEHENINIDKYETIFEITYLCYLADWFNIQPDIQYILNPAESRINNYAFIAGVRLSLIL